MEDTPAKQIKEKLDIADFLRSYLELRPAGRNFKALCPFHREKTPSFIVSPDRQTWHCFGCGIGGDVFSFLMKHESIEFGEALKMLAERAGIELRRISPMEYKQFGLLYDITASAKEFFVAELARSDRASEYLKVRGLGKEAISEFELGFAPQAPDALTVHLVRAGYDLADVIRAGCSFRTEKGLVLDRFRGRIMFPIQNHSGKAVGFTGRILPELDTGTMGKYVNSPETPIFMKSKILYGFSKTKQHIREAGVAFLVEGQMDFLASWQSGVRNVVATSGTALSRDHLAALLRVTNRLVLGLDSDEAGYAALERAIDLAEEADFDVLVATSAPHKDPADAVAADPEGVKKMIVGAVPAPEFYFRRYLPEKKGDVRSREYLDRLRFVLRKLSRIASPVARAAWMKTLSERTGVSDAALRDEAERMGVDPSSEKRADVPASKFLEEAKTRRELLIERILGTALGGGNVSAAEAVMGFFPERYLRVYELLAKGERRSSDPLIDADLNMVSLRAEAVTPEEFEMLRRELEKECAKDRRAELIEKVRAFEAEGDAAMLEATLKELADLPMP